MLDRDGVGLRVILGKVNRGLDRGLDEGNGGASWIRKVSMGVVWEEEHIDGV
jgi:hypothetical protein